MRNIALLEWGSGLSVQVPTQTGLSFGALEAQPRFSTSSRESS